MDAASIAFTKRKMHRSGVSYHRFILESGCKIKTVNALIESNLSEPEKSLAVKNYKMLRGNPEIFPFGVQVELARTIALNGPRDQAVGDVNIVMDLDIIQNSAAGKLPTNPTDILKDKNLIGTTVVCHTKTHGIDSASILEGAPKLVRDLWKYHEERFAAKA